MRKLSGNVLYLRIRNYETRRFVFNTSRAVKELHIFAEFLETIELRNFDLEHVQFRQNCSYFRKRLTTRSA